MDWIARGAAVLLLVATTACGSAVATPGTAPGPGATPGATVPGAGATPGVDTGADGPGVDTAHQQPASAGKALAALAALPVKGRAPKTGYSRDQFGPAWSDVDHNGCDTRNDVLRRDLTSVALKPGTHDCVVLSGILSDPYTAASINFQRGNATSTAVQIDHVVALSDAWQKGAQQLSPDRRLSFANDPLNLLAVDGPTNQAKSDGDAATWLPPNKSFRCAYVARQISVKSTYGLWVTQAEHDAMARVLAGCPDTVAPAGPPATSPAPAAQQPAPAQQAAQPAAPAQVPEAPAPAPPPAAGVYYANCTAVRAAGAAPIRAGQPGYSGKLDRDGDGVGCE
ncbi:DUF1524 domain-containing protein [Arthrobacter sp. PM3]|uniref:GmrSD restriction endonuclease domain-containing protein n=1 Tax=Arthrobacter sp. PM3 TaxID=2017685 RepID=UPI000E10E634|nr:deoxyribonuclease [Arthrobacter sp. PM3]